MPFEFSLWTDLSAETSEFLDQFEMLSTYQLQKINIFTLFDLSTLAAGQLNSKKVEFAKSIAQNFNNISQQVENEKYFKDTPFGRR